MKEGSPEKKTKVFHVIDSAGFGGGERYILDLVRHASPGILHQVIIPHGGRFKNQLDEARIPNRILDMNRRFSLASIRKLAGWIRRSGPALIHSHGYRANMYGRVAALITKNIHLCTVHVSLYDYVETPPWLRLVYLAAERLTADATSRFICISKAMAFDCERLGIGHKKLVIIPNGVDVTRFHPRTDNIEIRRELNITGTGPVIGTVGRLVPEKGQIHLLEAMARLKPSHPDLTCLIAGEGPLLHSLKAAAERLSVSRMCIFTGGRGDMERVYPVMDLFVLPSLREPFGLVLLEAMASGVPVLATAAGGPLDFIRSGVNGMLVPPADPEHLAGQIHILLSDKTLRERIALMALQTVRERFQSKLAAVRTEAVYRSLSRRMIKRMPSQK